MIQRFSVIGAGLDFCCAGHSVVFAEHALLRLTEAIHLAEKHWGRINCAEPACCQRQSAETLSVTILVSQRITPRENFGKVMVPCRRSEWGSLTGLLSGIVLGLVRFSGGRGQQLRRSELHKRSKCARSCCSKGRQGQSQCVPQFRHRRHFARPASTPIRSFSDSATVKLEGTVGYRAALGYCFSVTGSAGLGENIQASGSGDNFPYYVLRIGADVKATEDVTWNIITFRYRDGFDPDDNFLTPQVATGLSYDLDDHNSISGGVAQYNWKDWKPDTVGLELGYKYRF